MIHPTRNRALPVYFALTILLSAFLVFQVQPVISKTILPWFGGSPAVWTTCLLFFQVVLFAGYVYAHALTRYLRPAIQGLSHMALISIALWLVPIVPSADWKPTDASNPTWQILMLLAATVGVPYFLLSTTGPLVQAWFARTTGGASPYRLYALSNFGSLAALVSYPFVVEPLLGSNEQARLWSAVFCMFAILCGYCAWQIRQTCDGRAIPESKTDNDVERPSWGMRVSWIGYAAIPSVMLLAVTNHVCQDIAPTPFLWVLPLALYLVSLIICFERESWYSARWCGQATAVMILAVCAVMKLNQMLYLWLEVGVYAAALFLICLLCHGEMVRRKPAPRYLTSFYLMTSAGGALGGIVVAIVAPRVFSSYLELNLGLACCYVLAVIAAAGAVANSRWQPAPARATALAVAAFLGLLFVVHTQAAAWGVNLREISRDFYGVIVVDEAGVEGALEHRRFMRHGRVLHGLQYLHPAREALPTAYYTESSGVGRTIRALQQQKPAIRVGVVGLGVGTLATYARSDDVVRFYEINPEVLRLAKKHFTYLDHSAGKVECVLGDARLELEREPPQQYDLLVLDAFSGDAIPAHLLTRESLAIYQRHLAADGILAVHISNRHVNLEPVIVGLAAAGEYLACRIDTTDTSFASSPTTACWALLSRESTWFGASQLSEVSRPLSGRAIVWTDDRNDVFEILK